MSPLRKNTEYLYPNRDENEEKVQIQVKKDQKPVFYGEDAPRCLNCDAAIPPLMLEKAGEVAKEQAELLEKYEVLLHERHNSQRISRLIINEITRRTE